MKKTVKTTNLSQLLIDIQKKDVNIIPINLTDVMCAWKKYRKVCNKFNDCQKELILN